MITAIVLAAGESKRMGAANKLLLPFGETTLIGRVVSAVTASATGEVLVVVGHEAEAVREALVGHPVTFVHNAHYREGMTTSIHAGVAAASPEASGFMICLSDLPLIEPGELDQLIDAFEGRVREDPQCIVIPVHAGRRGNPVLFSAAYQPAILTHAGLMGCKGIVKQNPAHVLEVSLPTDHILRDIDPPAAYEALRR